MADANKRLRRIAEGAESALKISGPEIYEPAKLDLAWRTLTAAAAGKLVSARQLNRAMHIVALGSGLDGIPRSRRTVAGRGGGMQDLTRAMGRAQALEVMLSALGYDAGLPERYG